MRQNIIRRLLESIAALVGVTFVIFIMLRVIPGNPIEAMMGEHANQATIDRMTAELGLDRPIYIQFIRYIAGALRGDFGTSYSLGKPVAALMRTAFVNTLRLSLLASAFAWVVGVVCGVISAVRKNGLEDHLFMGFSLLGVSVPVFMIAMLLQFCFGYYFHLLPISGSAGWQNFILPSIALGWNSAAAISRLTRSTLMDVLTEDYIETARAKGLKESSVIIFHALRNAMLPVVTMMAIQFSGMLSGAVITETVFSINGIGRLAVQAISGRDIPLLQGTILFSTAIVILGNLTADCLYSVLDPRIRREA